MLHYVTLCYTMLLTFTYNDTYNDTNNDTKNDTNNVTLCYSMLNYVTLCYTMLHHVTLHTSQRCLCHWTCQRYLPVLLLTEVDKDSVWGMPSESAGWLELPRMLGRRQESLGAHWKRSKSTVQFYIHLQVLLPATVIADCQCFWHANWKPFLQFSILETYSRAWLCFPVFSLLSDFNCFKLQVWGQFWSELKVWLTLRTGQLLGALSTLKQLDQSCSRHLGYLGCV